MEKKGLTRREFGLLAAGGVFLGAGKVMAECNCPEGPACDWSDYPNTDNQNHYSYFESLPLFNPFDPNTKTTISPLRKDEMRITFMGSTIPSIRRIQRHMSIFVEVGWNDETDTPLDQFVFDLGSGVHANYAAMNAGFERMNKIFINHLHGDHMGDLPAVYCFGPSGGRKSPLYIFGPGPSRVESPKGSGKYYDDGTRAFCEHMRAACRWHSESFSFQTTSYPGYPTQSQIKRKWGLPRLPVPVSDDPWGDAYAMVPIQFNWQKYGVVPGDNVAYWNKETGVKITHYPVIHCRQGSVGYKLEWNGMSMIYSSDTKPEIHSRDQAINGGEGVDVFIHEMVLPAQVWTMKIGHSDVLPDPNSAGVQWTQMIQNSSHTPQGALGYLLSQITPRPRLTVATHFPTSDDTVQCALNSIQQHCPDVEFGKNFVVSFDLMVLKVTPRQITQWRGEVSDYGYGATVNLPSGTPNTAKYHDANNNGDPYQQINTSTAIPACGTNSCNYREDGF